MHNINDAIYRLRGSQILIGRDEQTSRLLVVTQIQGKQIKFTLAQPGSVPNCVSRCQPASNTAHCQLTIDPQGNIQISNLKPMNVTYVNGMQVFNCGISPDAQVQLGRNFYNLNVTEVLTSAMNAVNRVLPPVYSIKPLENVWNEYKQNLLNLKKRQKRLGLISRVSMVFTLPAGVLAGICDAIGMSEARPYFLVLTAIGAILTVVGFVLSARDKSIEQTDELTDRLQETYVCPNPLCRRFVGQQPYKVLKKARQCPYCRCTWES